MHAVEGEILCESINTKIPYFNANIVRTSPICVIIWADLGLHSFLESCNGLFEKLEYSQNPDRFSIETMLTFQSQFLENKVC